jgi:hypothetical protein
VEVAAVTAVVAQTREDFLWTRLEDLHRRSRGVLEVEEPIAARQVDELVSPSSHLLPHSINVARQEATALVVDSRETVRARIAQSESSGERGGRGPADGSGEGPV